MELIKPSSTIMHYDPNPLKHIELVARNCYKSEDKITDESAPKFVRNLYERGHHAMLEFYRFYFYLDTELSHKLLSINNHPDIDGDLMLWNIPDQPFTQASCNLRTAIMISKYDGCLAGAIILKMFNPLATDTPNWLFDKIRMTPDVVTVDEIGVEPFLRYLTARFICDRGVTHELVRHRKCSFAQESTRYCNYGKQENVKFIIPSQLTYQEGTYNSDYHITSEIMRGESTWFYNMLNSESEYKELITKGWSPQQARSVLPNSLKTEIIVQARLSEWKHIFEQRCSPKAHPDMQALMIPFRDKVCEIEMYKDYFKTNY